VTKRCIEKVFELAGPRFSRDMERDFRIRAIFPYCDRNHNRNRNRILNPWSWGTPHHWSSHLLDITRLQFIPDSFCLCRLLSFTTHQL